MRDPKERLHEIHKRADARIAAIKYRNRMILGACTTLALCLVIGLGIYRLSSLPETPPLQVSDPTTTVYVTTAEPTVTQTTGTIPSVASSATVSSETTTTLFDALVSVIESTNPPIASVTTSAVSTTASTDRSSHTSSSKTTIVFTDTTAIPHETVVRTTTTAPFLGDDFGEAPSSVTTYYTTTYTTPSSGSHSGEDWSPITTYPTPTTTATHATITTTSAPSADREPMAPCDPTDPPEDSTTTTSVHRDYVCFTMGAAYEVKAGDIITLDVSISDNHYLLYGMITFYYDTNKLELLKVNDDPNNPYTDYVNTDILPENSLWSFSTPYKGGLEFAFMSTAFCGPAQGGTLFRLTFRVLDGFDGLTHINLNVPYAVAAAECNPDGSSNVYTPPKMTGSGYISAKKKPSSPYW